MITKELGFQRFDHEIRPPGKRRVSGASNIAALVPTCFPEEVGPGERDHEHQKTEGSAAAFRVPPSTAKKW